MTQNENEKSEGLVAIKELFDEAIPKIKKVMGDNITDAEEENGNSQTSYFLTEFKNRKEI